MRHQIEQGFLIGAVLAACLVAWIYWTGGTFGQRCEKMHPNADAETIEQCVQKLYHAK